MKQVIPALHHYLLRQNSFAAAEIFAW